jgi:hypothetical protein
MKLKYSKYIINNKYNSSSFKALIFIKEYLFLFIIIISLFIIVSLFIIILFILN